MQRRDIIKFIGLGALAMRSFPAFSAGVLNNAHLQTSKIPLGLCNHSLRSRQLNARQLIEYTTVHKLDSLLLNTFQPFESIESGHLATLSKMAKTNDVSIYIGVGSISEKSTKFSDKYGTAQPCK